MKRRRLPWLFCMVLICLLVGCGEDASNGDLQKNEAATPFGESLSSDFADVTGTEKENTDSGINSTAVDNSQIALEATEPNQNNPESPDPVVEDLSPDRLSEQEATEQDQENINITQDDVEITLMEQPDENSGFYPIINNVAVVMNQKAAPLLAAIGPYEEYFETISCGFEGIDRIYYYNGFEIGTYPYQELDYINQVYITGKNILTAEGIGVGSTKAEMVSVYGKEYTEEFDVCTYQRGDSILQFAFDGTYIFSIEYLAIPPKEVMAVSNQLTYPTKQIEVIRLTKLSGERFLIPSESDSVRYSSSNKDVAYISQDGMLTTKLGGNSIISLPTIGAVEKQYRIHVKKNNALGEVKVLPLAYEEYLSMHKGLTLSDLLIKPEKSKESKELENEEASQIEETKEEETIEENKEKEPDESVEEKTKNKEKELDESIEEKTKNKEKELDESIEEKTKKQEKTQAEDENTIETVPKEATEDTEEENQEKNPDENPDENPKENILEENQEEDTLWEENSELLPNLPAHQLPQIQQSDETVDKTNEETDETFFQIASYVVSNYRVEYHISDQSYQVFYNEPDKEAPLICCAYDRTYILGDAIDYYKDVFVLDERDEHPKLTVDTKSVNEDKPGKYKLTYIATDANGNEAREQVTFTILAEAPEGYVSLSKIDKDVESLLSRILKDAKTDEEKARAIYQYVRESISYTNGPHPEDWLQHAYKGMTRKNGDCTMYMALSRLLLMKAGIPNVTMERKKGATPNATHFWNLAYIDGEWYHFDTCIRAAGGIFCLLTDEQIKEYTKIKGSGTSHLWDENIVYPERSKMTITSGYYDYQ